MSGQLLRFIPFLLLAGFFQFGGSVMGQSNVQASSSEEVNQLLSRLKKTSGNMDSVRDRLRRLEARVLGKPEPPPYVPEERCLCQYQGIIKPNHCHANRFPNKQ